MSGDLKLAIDSLRRAIESNGEAPTVLPAATLEEQFHGLTLGQLVMLVDAPALVVALQQRSADGALTERFVIDGKDGARCVAAAERLLLDPATTLADGDVREVRIVSAAVPPQTFVRDHNDTVYRVTDKEAAIAPELTEVLRQRRRSQQTNVPAPVVGMAGEILHGLTAIRSSAEAVFEEVRKLLRATGQRTPEAAISAADPAMLSEAFRRSFLMAEQVDALAEAVGQRMRALISALDGRPDLPARPPE